MASRNLTTFIARASDALMVVATMDNNFESEDIKSHAKKIIKSLSPDSPAKCIMEGGDVLYAYLLDQGVVYLTVTDRSFPRFVIFEYLRELASAFSLEFGTSVPLFNRPFAAVSFDTTLEQIRRRFMDPQSQGGHGMQRLNNNLAEIHDIMSRNINDIVNRGDRLSDIENRSNQILADSRAIKKHAKYANFLSMIKAWGPAIAAVVVIMFVLYFRFK